MTRLVLLELNEVNFEHLEVYVGQGELPNFARLLGEHGVSETTSETAYEELEPWIQWITAHTGLSLAEHGVFRLGDIVNHDIPQIWESLEERGLTVGAISPMNAKNRCRSPAFFVPDPWTNGRLAAGPILKHLYAAISQAVNDNAQTRIAAKSAAWLLTGALSYARMENYPAYAKMALASRSAPWARAMVLDLLLTDVFIRETARTRPDFASLFLNAAAHIQHHYMFNSRAYDGEQRNPEWYVPPDADPVLEIYRLYDRILGQIRTSFPTARLMMATGLHQDPHPENTFYWRLLDHDAFLRKIGVPFVRVEPRMSRDFVVFCESAAQARRAEEIFGSARDSIGTPLFEVDNRGADLFVMLSYPLDIGDDFPFSVGDRNYGNLHRDVAFVAIKNGRHNGVGYYLDTGLPSGRSPARFPLKEIPQRICDALNVPWARNTALDAPQVGVR